MELYDFMEQYNYENVSDVALLKQREKLNEEIFKELNKSSLKDFYHLFPEEVKTFKGYILTAIDGSDCEIPNTPITRERYQSKSGKNDGKVARIKLSNCYDLLNHYVLDTELEEYKHSENELAKRHMKEIEEIIKDYPIISIRDRGYLSLSYMFHSVMENKKFVIRLNQRYFKLEQNLMALLMMTGLKSNINMIELENIYKMIRNYIIIMKVEKQ